MEIVRMQRLCLDQAGRHHIRGTGDQNRVLANRKYQSKKGGNAFCSAYS